MTYEYFAIHQKSYPTSLNFLKIRIKFCHMSLVLSLTLDY